MATLENIFAFRTYTGLAPTGSTPFQTYGAYNTDWFWLSYSGNSTDDIIEYYADLLILQYLGKPKAYETIRTMVGPIIMDQLPAQVQNAFNLTGSDIAVGVQLDVLGKYVGVTRTGTGFYNPITLDDTDFLTLINMAILRNNAGSSLYDIELLLNQYFAGEVYVFDYKNMTMSYLIDTSVGSQDLIDLFVTEHLLPKPMGVGITVIAYPNPTSLFGLRTYAGPNNLATPLNNYTSYNNSWFVLSYQDAIPTS